MIIARKCLSFLVLASLISTMPAAQAHHAFAAEYDINQPITLKGKLTKVEWINPHGWVHVDAVDQGGKTANWAVEFGGPNALLRRGLRKSDFPVGIDVVVNGYRAKDGRDVIAATNVTLPDGRSIYAGTEGTGAPKE
jgi:hypothetical protein